MIRNIVIASAAKQSTLVILNAVKDLCKDPFASLRMTKGLDCRVATLLAMTGRAQ